MYNWENGLNLTHKLDRKYLRNSTLSDKIFIVKCWYGYTHICRHVYMNDITRSCIQHIYEWKVIRQLAPVFIYNTFPASVVCQYRHSIDINNEPHPREIRCVSNWTYGIVYTMSHNECDGVSNHRRHDCLLVCSGADQRKHQSSASLAFVRGIHRSPVNSAHKGPVTRKMFPFDDVIMIFWLVPIGIYWQYHCGPVTPYGDKDLGQNWLRHWLITRRH